MGFENTQMNSSMMSSKCGEKFWFSFKTKQQLSCNEYLYAYVEWNPNNSAATKYYAYVSR